MSSRRPLRREGRRFAITARRMANSDIFNTPSKSTIERACRA
jgi:hypothetical protein